VPSEALRLLTEASRLRDVGDQSARAMEDRARQILADESLFQKDMR
jgi:hypothetical protein